MVGHAEELTSRLVGSMSRLAVQARQGARRVKNAAHDLRTSQVVQHAVAARARGNMEAAFWLLNEEFTRCPDDPGVALHYWDVALSLGRVPLAGKAGVKLIESRAANGETALAAQHWLELSQEAPDVLVSPTAIATILPALKARLAETPEEERKTLAGYLRRAVRHAVDPRNTGLHPGVALRIFEEGREINPEAARRAAEAALESPNLHDAKRERLATWLSGKPVASSSPPVEPKPAARTHAPAATEAAPSEELATDGLSSEEIERAAARLARTKPIEPQRIEPATSEPKRAEPEPREPKLAAAMGPAVEPGILTELTDDGLVVRGGVGGSVNGKESGKGGGAETGCVPYDEIQAVSVAEIMGLEDQPVAVIDLILNWTRRLDEPLEIIRLRTDELDLERLVTRKHALGSDFAALMGEIMERTCAIPLPDPESALGTRISCFASPALYEAIALREGDRAAA